MTTGATAQLGLALPVQGELSGTWGDTVNNGITQYTNIAIAGTLTLTGDGAVTLANTTGDASASNITSSLTGAGTVTAQFAIVKVTGTLTTTKVVTGPSYSKTYTVVNSATGGAVTFKASGQTGVSVAVGETAFVYFNGTDYVKVVGTATAGAAGGSNTQVQYNSSGVLAGSANLTFNGTTLTANTLNLTNALGTAYGGTGLTSTPANGALDIGNGTGFTRTTLTAGSNVTITNGAGSITIASSGASAATPTALGTVYGNTSSSTGVTAIGYQALNVNTATNVSAFGAQAGVANTSGYIDAFGSGAGGSNTTGKLAAFGYAVAFANTTGSGNAAFGGYDGSSNPTFRFNTTGSANSAFGFGALAANTTASNNTAVGYQALYANTTGDISVAVGVNALKAQTTGTQNTAAGYGAGAKLTTSSYNVAIGTSALGNMVNGANQNVAIGQNALLNYVNTSVSEGGAVAVGAAALQNCTTGGSNIAMGRNAGLSITTGALNVVIGDRAGESANSSQGVYLGAFCGIYTTGNDNTFLGWQAGHYTTSTTTGSQNTYVGSGARGSAVSNTYEIVLGAYATGKGSSTGFINPNSGGVYQGNNSSSWSTTSDQRLKKNIADNNDGLNKITSIRVRNFEYRLPEEVDAELKPTDAIQKTGVQLGVIAQELQAVLPECVKQESTGVLSVDTDNLTWYLINAVKQLKAEIDQLKGN